MVAKIGIASQRSILCLLIVFSCFFIAGCTGMIAETIVEKSAGKEVLYFTQARFGELEQYMENKMMNQAAVSSTDRFFLCVAYAKVKRYNKLFSCLEQSEQHLSD